MAYADCTNAVGLCHFSFAFFQHLLAGVSLSTSHANVNQTLSTTLPTVPGLGFVPAEDAVWANVADLVCIVQDQTPSFASPENPPSMANPAANQKPGTFSNDMWDGLGSPPTLV